MHPATSSQADMPSQDGLGEVAFTAEPMGDPIDGIVVEPTLAERGVAFFVALADDEVDKDWKEIGQTLMLVAPAVVAFSVSKRGKISRVRELVAPGIALGRLIVGVNRQVGPQHLDRAHKIVERARTNAELMAQTLKERVQHRESKGKN